MRSKRTSGQLTPLELKIMDVLWASSPSNVQAVQTRLPGRPLAYTTVQTMLNVLHRKGKVKRTLKGRAYQYSPRLSRRNAIGSALRDIVSRLFAGSAEKLVMSLVELNHLTPKKLADLQKLIEKTERATEKSDGYN